jgi:tetratricopeptide (TPR) repeat protein
MGYAYGTVGADLHVDADGSPLYLLTRWERAERPSGEWLSELPSRLLNARHRVVTFTGRQTELAEYRQWLAGPAPIAVRWLYGPGGQGKTRLADEVAGRAQDDGWLVVTASTGAGPVQPPPGSQDLRADRATGILLIADYADRWPLSSLALLLDNRLLTEATVPVRVLFLARTDAAWRGLATALDPGRLALSDERLAPLDATGAARRQMFEAAHDGFLAYFGAAVPVPVDLLAGPEFGLTLAVHMAALVAVDARQRDRPLPTDLAGLTLYLLDREQLHWADRHAAGGRLRPDAMKRVVFIATVCGTQPVDAAVTLLRDLLPDGVDPAVAADDHAACYPGEATAARCEPLYPDRLAEDFVALTLDGHGVAYPAGEWAGPLLTRLLGREEDGSPRPWLPRAVSTLAAATLRWPHVGAGHLYPVLRADPRLAVEAGGDSLSTLTAADGIDLDLLAEIEEHLPKGRYLDLDVAALAVQQRLADQRLAGASTPRERGDVHADLGYRLNVTGHRDPARAEMAAAVECYRVAATPGEPDADLAHALMNLAHTELDVGRRPQALASAEEARDLYRALAGHEPDLAYAWSTLGTVLAALGRHEEAVDACTESVRLHEDLAEADLDQYETELAGALGNRGSWRHSLGQYDQALADARRATAIYRRRAAQDPNAYLHEVAAALVNEGMQLDGLRRYAEAAEVMTESVAAFRKLADLRPDSFEHFLATALSNLSEPLFHVGRTAEALAASAEAVEIRRRLAAARPGVFTADLAIGLNNHAVDQLAAGQAEEALGTVTEAVAIRRRLAADDPATYEVYLASSLNNQGKVQLTLGRDAEAAESYREATAIYRRLEAKRPAAHRVHLVATLTGHARALLALDRNDDAVATAGEAAALTRELDAVDLATGLTVLAVARQAAGAVDEARAAVEEAVGVYAALPAEVLARPEVAELRAEAEGLRR